MRDLRIRFGAVLALAMTPLLTFSIWQSYYDYKRDSEAQSAALVLSARQSATEVLNTLERAESVLRAVDQTLNDLDDCESTIGGIAAEFSGFDQFYIADPEGRYICTTDEIAVQRRRFQYVDRLSADSPTALITRDTVSRQNENLPIIRVAYGSYRAGELHRVMIIDVLTQALSVEDIVASVKANDVQISILNSNADILAGHDIQSAEKRAEWIQAAKANSEFRSHYRGDYNQERDVIIVPAANAGLFIVFSQPHQTALLWNFVNPLSSALVPIIAWIFGFIAIWIATDKLILVHLRKIRTSAVQFARGDHHQRIGDLENPPASIRDLGRTLDLMADKVTTRESELADSVVEKDMLLREIHHRVKNNLQIIISLLNMQERKLDDPQGLAAIKDTRSRINAIALVHRGLYESDDLRFIPMGVFVERLMDELGVALGVGELGITITSETDCSPIETDTAIPVALFFVEAMTNSVKHGVSDGGTIHVVLKQTGDEIIASVIDSGPGFIEDAKAAGTGTKLIKGFARQLSGELTQRTFKGGHEIQMAFTHRPYANDI